MRLEAANGRTLHLQSARWRLAWGASDGLGPLGVAVELGIRGWAQLRLASC